MPASASSGGASVAAFPPVGGQSEDDASMFCGEDGTPLPRGEGVGGSERAERYHIHTFGCQMNMADSERMAGALESLGYAHAPKIEDADVLVYNTCSIRDKAEQKLYNALQPHVARKAKRKSDLKIVVAGCVAGQEGEALLRRVPQVDVVMGPQHANRIGSLLEQVGLGHQVVATGDTYIEEDIAKPVRESSVRAWVNVIYGCNEVCTYCVVPGARGKEQSRDPDAIKMEMMGLGAAGYKEVCLLGQNIDAYGRDLPGTATDGSGRRRWTFTDLLRHVHDVEGIERIRFATSHPRYFTERLIATLAELPKVCKYFHIPFQSGSNKVLKDMKRGYTHEKFRSIVRKVREYMPDASVSADAIVGFPGETEEEFMETVNLIEELEFDQVNTAAYSPRPNTPAAEWDNQVADLIKADRLQRINRVVQDCAWRRSQRYLGRVERVLVEDVNPKHEGMMMVCRRSMAVPCLPFRRCVSSIPRFLSVSKADRLTPVSCARCVQPPV